MAGGIAQEHTRRWSDCAPLDWAASVVCRPEASVAPGTIFSQSIYPCISYQLLAELTLWAGGVTVHYSSHRPSQGKMTPEAEDDPTRRLPLQLQQVLLC